MAEAQATLCETLELAQTGSVILTNDEVPVAVVLPFAMLEDVRQAVMRLLVDEMADSFKRMQATAQALPPCEPTSEAELESLAGEVVRRARRPANTSGSARTGL